jgi:hypothetical protein
MTNAQKTAIEGLDDFKKEKFLLILSSAGDKPKKGDGDKVKETPFDRAVREKGKNDFGNFYFCYMSSDDVKPIFLGRYEEFLKQLRHKVDPS